MVVKVTKLHVQNWTGDGMEVGWKTGRGGGAEREEYQHSPLSRLLL